MNMFKICICILLINSSSQKLKVNSVLLQYSLPLEVYSFLRTRSQRSEDIRKAKYDNAKYTIRRVTVTLRLVSPSESLDHRLLYTKQLTEVRYFHYCWSTYPFNTAKVRFPLWTMLIN